MESEVRIKCTVTVIRTVILHRNPPAATDAPTEGFSNSENIQGGIGIVALSASKGSDGTSGSVGASYGPTFGGEISDTENLTETYELMDGYSICEASGR